MSYCKAASKVVFNRQPSLAIPCRDPESGLFAPRMMNKFLVRLLCCFVPVGAWRKSLRRGLRLRAKRRKQLDKFNTIADWKFETVDGVKVARGVLDGGQTLRLGHLFGMDLTPMGVAHGVLAFGEYHFAAEGESVVIDIGMNVGIVSLYFAMRDDVVRVYGYEPVPATYRKALFNFRLNAAYADKITPHNCGLGAAKKSVTMRFKEWHSGSASMVSTVDWNRAYGPNGSASMVSHRSGEPIAIEVLDAAAEIGDIISRHRDQRIVIKCDTEGAEKEIFARLDDAGVLARVDIIVMEYHIGYDRFIEPILLRNGFALFKTEQNTGLIRAVKQRTIGRG